jgi:hypothetical protein
MSRRPFLPTTFSLLTEIDMKIRSFGLGSLVIALALLACAAACSSLQVPNNPTTQALDDASAITGAAAAAVAAAAPVPWGQILAAVLGAISVIAGIIAHSTVTRNNSQQVASAVTSGFQAVSQSLAPASLASVAVAK